MRHYSAQIPVGNADKNGFARMDKVFYKLPYGDGGKADLFFMFSSDLRQEPKYMGQYWSMPFFDSVLLKISPNRYRWFAPDLTAYTFDKAKDVERGCKETYILNSGDYLKLNVANNGTIYIEHKKDKQRRFEFEDGKLVKFCARKGADVFRIVYAKSGNPRYLYNTTKNESVLEFAYNKSGLLANIRMAKENKNVEIGYGNFESYAIDGKTKQKFRAIASIKYADGEIWEYSYSPESEKKDRAVLANKDGKTHNVKVPINKIEQKHGKDVGYIEWDASTGVVVSDSGGEYAVYNPIRDKFNGEYMNPKNIESRKPNKIAKEAIIAYKKPEYKYPEMWGYDARTAIRIMQNPQTGELTRIYYIGGGNATGRPRKTEKKAYGASEWKTVKTRFYNPNGDLIRESDSEGNVREIFYNEKFEKVKTVLNGETIYEMKHLPDGKTEIFEKDEYNGELTKKIIFADGKYLVKTRVSPDTEMFCVVYDENKNRVVALYATADTADDLKFFADNFKMRLVVEPKLRAPFKLFIDKSKDLREISFNESLLNFMNIHIFSTVIDENGDMGVIHCGCGLPKYIMCGAEYSYNDSLNSQYLVYGLVESFLEVIKDVILNPKPKKVKTIKITASLDNFVKIRGLDPNKLTVYSKPIILKGEVLEQWLALAKSYIPASENLQYTSP